MGPDQKNQTNQFWLVITSSLQEDRIHRLPVAESSDKSEVS